MAGTAAQFIAQLDARLGKPYSEVIDGGVGPDYYDCSGLMDVCLNAIGIPYTRSTYTQWDDERYEHFGPFAFGQALPPLETGDILYMHVAGEADPGHVGAYDGSGLYIDAPHTGAFVRTETIPNTPDEHVYGIIRPPFGAPSPGPTPTPSPPPPTGDAEMLTEVVTFKPNQLDVFQVKSGGLIHYWFDGGWLSEVIAGPLGGVSGKVVTLALVEPKFSIQVGQAMVAVEDTAGNPWIFNQAITGITWSGGAI